MWLYIGLHLITFKLMILQKPYEMHTSKVPLTKTSIQLNFFSFLIVTYYSLAFHWQKKRKDKQMILGLLWSDFISIQMMLQRMD